MRRRKFCRCGWRSGREARIRSALENRSGLRKDSRIRVRSAGTVPPGLNKLRKKAEVRSIFDGKHTSGAEAHGDSLAFVPGINPRPTARTSFSAACEVVP